MSAMAGKTLPTQDRLMMAALLTLGPGNITMATFADLALKGLDHFRPFAGMHGVTLGAALFGIRRVGLFPLGKPRLMTADAKAINLAGKDNRPVLAGLMTVAAFPRPHGLVGDRFQQPRLFGTVRIMAFQTGGADRQHEMGLLIGCQVRVMAGKTERHQVGEFMEHGLGEFIGRVAVITERRPVFLQELGIGAIVDIMTGQTLPFDHRRMDHLQSGFVISLLMAGEALLGRIQLEVQTADHPVRHMTGAAILLGHRRMHHALTIPGNHLRVAIKAFLLHRPGRRRRGSGAASN